MKKSSSKKISERYVDALFDIVQQSNIIEVIEKDLSQISVLIEENSDFHDFLHNPLLTREAQGEIVTGLLYINEEAEDLHQHLHTTERPFNELGPQELTPEASVLDRINQSLR